MKWKATVLAVVMIAFVAFIAWYRWDSGQNRGYTFGYYGVFNTVDRALSEIPGVTVTGSDGNEDITFEEFVFNIKTADGKQISLWFGEQDPIRKMSGEQLTKALINKIEGESSNDNISTKEK